MSRNLEILFKFWLNSGYRKSQKALDFSTLKNLIDFWLYIYIANPPTPKRLPRTLESCRKSADNSRDICAVAHAQNLPTKPTTGTQKFPKIDGFLNFNPH